MKGLIRNNFYSMESNMGISFILAAFLAVMPFFLRNSSFLPIILSIQIWAFIANTGTSLHGDTVSRWSKYELTLPVKRSDVVVAKYISFAILIFLGVFMGMLTLLSFWLAKIPVAPSDLIDGYGYGLTLSAISVGIMYPVMLKLGTDKNELILVLSAFAAIGIILLITFILSPWTDGMNMHHSLVSIVSTIAAFLIFVLSCFLSIRIQQRKEFH